MVFRYHVKMKYLWKWYHQCLNTFLQPPLISHGISPSGNQRYWGDRGIQALQARGPGGTPAPGGTLTTKIYVHERMHPGVGFILKYSGLCVHVCVFGVRPGMPNADSCWTWIIGSWDLFLLFSVSLCVPGGHLSLCQLTRGSYCGHSEVQPHNLRGQLGDGRD